MQHSIHSHIAIRLRKIGLRMIIHNILQLRTKYPTFSCSFRSYNSSPRTSVDNCISAVATCTCLSFPKFCRCRIRSIILVVANTHDNIKWKKESKNRKLPFWRSPHLQITQYMQEVNMKSNSCFTQYLRTARSRKKHSALPELETDEDAVINEGAEFNDLIRSCD